MQTTLQADSWLGPKDEIELPKSDIFCRVDRDDDEYHSIGKIGFQHEYPKELVDNEFILTGYRIGFKGFTNSLKTLLMVHNETVNVWSHIIGKLIFITLMMYVIVTYPYMSESVDMRGRKPF